MLDIKKYKKISLGFRRLASNFLRTEYTNQDIPLRRFLNYIEREETIKNIIDKKIKNVEFDYRECFVKDKFGRSYIDIPLDEGEHIKAMYDYLKYIVENDICLERLAMEYPCESRKINDILQNFIDLAFKPLVDYIQDEISKIMIMMEKDKMEKIDMSNNQGVINYADRMSSIKSDNVIKENDIENIFKIIDTIKNNLNELDLSDEEKDNVLDDVEVVQEQIQSNITKPARIKKAINNIKFFLTNTAVLTGTGVTLANNIKQLLAIVQPIIDKL